jgi:hypothetical protein
MTKNNYIKIKLDDIEFSRINEIQKLTHQKRSEICREALYLLIFKRYPSLLKLPGQDGQDEMAF